jgi:hypothetical protein
LYSVLSCLSPLDFISMGLSADMLGKRLWNRFYELVNAVIYRLDAFK